MCTFMTGSRTIFIKWPAGYNCVGYVYYSLVSWLLYMFRAMLSLIIRSIWTIVTASGFIHVYRRLLSWLIIAHYQEHLNCSYSFGFIHVYRCRLLSWLIIAHYQEHLNCSYSFGFIHVYRRLLSWLIIAHYQDHLNCSYSSGFIHVYRRLLSWLSHDNSWQWYTWIKPEL